MSTFIGSLILIWVLAIIFKLRKRTLSNNRRTNEGYFYRLRLLSLPEKIFIVCFVLLDLLVIILSTQNYFFIFLKPTSVIIPAVLTFIAICFLIKGLKLANFWVTLVTVLALPGLILFWLSNSLLNNSYKTVESPTGKEKIIIEHREATLGETKHFYNFYRKTSPLGLMKKLNPKTVQIRTRGTDEDNLKILGVDHAKWVDGEYVTFRSPYAETKVELKY